MAIQWRCNRQQSQPSVLQLLHVAKLKGRLGGHGGSHLSRRQPHCWRGTATSASDLVEGPWQCVRFNTNTGPHRTTTPGVSAARGGAEVQQSKPTRTPRPPTQPGPRAGPWTLTRVTRVDWANVGVGSPLEDASGGWDRE